MRTSNAPFEASMGQKEWDPADVFDLMGDDLTRRILALASERPFSAAELAEAMDASNPTIYRRINALLEYDLVDEHLQIDSEGNHYNTFESTLNRIAFEIEDGGYTVEIETRQDLVEQFDEFWSGLGESRIDETVERGENSDRPGPRRDTYHG